jgi:hypothetical protein
MFPSLLSNNVKRQVELAAAGSADAIAAVVSAEPDSDCLLDPRASLYLGASAAIPAAIALAISAAG